MFQKVLIANRGEIAVRAIRACREMGIKTVAVYSQADKESLHVKYADEAVCIGKNVASDSYLDSYRILSTAVLTKADAIYPGTGFFSENANFSELCDSCGIKFIGAKSDTLRALGDKMRAKELAQKAGVPIVPASKELADSPEKCRELADAVGYPVILKAVDGGGGKGIRIVHNKEDLEKSYLMCLKEAESAFGSDKIFVERFVGDARHIEVQILADTHGNVIHLYDRDCTMQRRSQKLIEEAPSVFIPDEIKEHIYEDAKRLIKSIGYAGAATVEFLYERSGNYYFMEVNPRVQVEHTVTENITGVDIVKEQIRIAAGQELSVTTLPKPTLHSIECRINAEDSKFMCSTGTITKCTFPQGGGIRVETFVQAGTVIGPFYDSMIAKIISTAPTRELAIARMVEALSELDIEGVNTNKRFQMDLIQTAEFYDGSSNTTFVEEKLW